MAIARIAVLIVLFYLHSIIAWDSDAICYPHQHPVGFIGDCHKAIASIPNGSLHLDPSLNTFKDRHQSKPISLDFQHPGRFQKYLLPAAFRSGSCIVSVRSAAQTKPLQRGGTVYHIKPPANAATAMYFTVWPNVRRVARKVLAACPVTSKEGGTIVTDSVLEGWQFCYWVTVMGAEKKMPKGNRKLDLQGVFGGVHNVYDADEAFGHPGALLSGAPSGVGVRVGVKRPR